MLFISKGVPYIKDNKISVWKDGKIIRLTANQQKLWKFFYGDIKTYQQLLKYMLHLCVKDMPMSKDLMNQTVKQLKSLEILSYTENDEKIDRFTLVFSNKVMPIKKEGLKEEVDLDYYNMITSHDNMSVADIIAYQCNLQYDKLTNGYDLEYLKFVFEKSAYGVVDTIMASVIRMLKSGNLYLD